MDLNDLIILSEQHRVTFHIIHEGRFYPRLEVTRERWTVHCSTKEPGKGYAKITWSGTGYGWTPEEALLEALDNYQAKTYTRAPWAPAVKPKVRLADLDLEIEL